MKRLEPKPDFPSLEEEMLKTWEKEQVFLRTLAKPAPRGDFIFWEGPPTANGRPGIHHVLARTFKDLILRYKTMRGFRVPRKAGWDTHGLPVELEVEKKLGISGKKQIENIVPGDRRASIIKFNQLCKESVWQYKEEWERLTKRIGFWLDLDHPYITYENDFIQSVWQVFNHVSTQKDAEGRELLYEGYKVVPFCPRCGTTLSSHEVAQGYKTIKDKSVYLKFRLQDFDQPKVSILSWTTTPWTLPGNVALAVGKEIKYALVKFNQEKFVDEWTIVAKARLPELAKRGIVEETIKREFLGEELVGLSYEPLFSGAISPNEQCFKIHAADFVTTEDGTGVVHTAVMYGEDDYELGLKIGLPQVHTVTEQGQFVESLGEPLAGKSVKAIETEKLILAELEKQQNLVAEELYEHDYPFCWRCDTPLLYYARTSWYIRMSSLRDQLVNANEQIHWEPTTIKEGRMGEWLKNIKDWAISRERYWGTPLPFWRCADQHLTVVGSVDELKALGASVPEDLHKPYIDEVEFVCPVCTKPAKRIEEVADVWFDSGAMPFGQWGYPHLKYSEEQVRENYPADYISEAIDQTRGWFYTLLAVATLMERETPFENVICLGHVLDEQGKKMSKSRGNIVVPKDVIDQFGADALRLYLVTVNQPGEPKRFAVKGVGETLRKHLLILWNVANYWQSYWARTQEETKTDNFLDRWARARLHQVGETMTLALDRYDVYAAVRELTQWIDELSTWYLRRSRGRNDPGVRYTFRLALSYTLRWLAPLAPFVSDYLWRALELNQTHENGSIHLEDWPEPPADWQNETILEKMLLARKLVELGHAERAIAGVKLRQPLRAAKFGGMRELELEIQAILKDELNVKQIKVESGEELKVELDTLITPELKREGLMRETVRQIQALRKETGLEVNQTAVIEWDSDDEELSDILGGEEIKRLLPQTQLLRNKDLPREHQILVDGRVIWMAVKKDQS